MKEINYEQLSSMALDGLNAVLLFKPRKKMCTLQTKILEKMEKDSGDIGFYKINVEKNAKVSFKYKAFSLPSILIFRDSNHEYTLSGNYDESQIRFHLKN